MHRNSSVVAFVSMTDTPQEASKPKTQKGRSSRRYVRSMNPCSLPLDYDKEQVEFMLAVLRFRERTGVVFPTWTEILGILKSLGYQKVEAQPCKH